MECNAVWVKNAPSECQKVMNDIYSASTAFTIVYIDDVLIFSKSVDQHYKHLNIFINATKRAGLAVSAKKIKAFSNRN